MADRVLRARALIDYINSNGLVGKVSRSLLCSCVVADTVKQLSQSSRRQLSQDAERLSAAVALWHHQNARLAFVCHLFPRSLADRGRTVMESRICSARLCIRYCETLESISERIWSDISSELRYVASFAPLLGADLLYRLLGLVRWWSRSQSSRRISSTLLPIIIFDQLPSTKPMLSFSYVTFVSCCCTVAECYIQLVFKAVARHRLDSSTLYALDPTLLPTELWTSRPSILEGLQYHFEASTALLRERIRDFGSALEEDSHSSASGTELANQQALQKDFKSQMAELAGFVFRIFEERILVLGTAMENRASATEYRAVSERYLVVRSHIIHVLGQFSLTFQKSY